VVDRAFVTYTNHAKQQMLGVPASTIEKYGAVSRETVEAMVRGAMAQAPVNIAVAITGIAGPTGATPAKPVGLVHFAAASRSGQFVHGERRFGDIGRTEVRKQSVRHALALLGEIAEREPASP
jgi:nicotinamide-nucleotide amidase